MKGALERDDAIALGLTIRRVELARGLDRALHGLSAGIAEEYEVGEARRAQPRRQAFRLRDAIEIGDVDQLAGLLADRSRELRMAVAKRVHRHAGGEVEIALAIGGREPNALAPLEGEIRPRIGRQQMRCRRR